MSTAVNLADPRQQERIAERYRQLRSRVDRSRPIYEQFKRGELSSFNAAQRKIVEEFPYWMEDLEELRQGRMPAPRAKASTSLSTAAATIAEEQADTIPGLAPLVSKSKKHGKKVGGAGAAHDASCANTNDAPEREAADSHVENGKGSEAQPAADTGVGADEEEEEEEADAGEITTEEDLMATLLAMRSRDVQVELIHAYVDRHMAHQSQAQKDLTDAEKKLATAEGVKKKIISGAVKTPSKAQLSLIEQLPSLRKQVAAARKKVKKEDQQMREDLLQKLVAVAGEEVVSDAEEAEEEVEEEEAAEEAQPRTSAAAVNGESDADAPPVSAVAVAAAAAAPEEDNPWAADSAPAERTSPEPEAEEDTKPPAESEHAAEKPQPEEDGEITSGGTPEPAPEEEEVEAEEKEETREPTPPPPPPPVNVTFTPGSDWGKLRYSKSEPEGFTLDTFIELAGPACRREVEAAAAAARSSPSQAHHEAQDNSAEGATATAAGAVAPYAVDSSAGYVRQHLPIGPAERSFTSAPTHEDEGDAHVEEAAATTGLPTTWLARLQQELVQLQEKPIPRVSVRAARRARAAASANKEEEDREARRWIGARPVEEVQWHVDVAPADGPLVGQQVHLTVTFPPAYPFVPPTVRCPVAMPHKSFVVSQTGQANTLFLTYRNSSPCTPRSPCGGKHADGAKGRKKHSTATSAAAAISTGGWLPDMGARVVLQELQDFFSADSFAATARALGAAAFEQEMTKARVALALHRARCDQCGASRLSNGSSDVTCVNGPFFVLATDEVAEGNAAEEQEGKEGAEHAGRRGGAKARKARYDSGTSVREGAIEGPFVGCWANLLYSQRTSLSAAASANHAVFVRLELAGLAEQPPTVEIYKAPPPAAALLSPSASPGKRAGGGRGLAPWAGALLTPLSAAEDGRKGATETPIWTLPTSAWRSDGAAGRQSCVVEIASGDQRGTTTRPGGSGPSTAAAAVVATLPESTAEDAAFALVVRVAEQGQRVRATFTTNARTATAAHDAESSDDASSLLSSWPEAQALVAASAGAKQPPPARRRGFLVSVPFGFAGTASAEEYLSSVFGGGAGGGRGLEEDPVAAAARHEGYYIPRRVTFHLRDGAAPVVASEEVFFHYKALLAGTRRGQSRRPGGAAEESQETFLAMAPEEVVRRHVLGDKSGRAAAGGGGGGGAKAQRVFAPAKSHASSNNGSSQGRPLSSPSAIAALSDLFLGLRTVYLPCSPCSPADLAKFKDTCMLLYRNPQASTKYKAPFRPICALHFLSLVLRHVVEVAADTEKDGSDEQIHQLAKAVVKQVLALASQLADSDKAFQSLCKSLTATATGSVDPERPFLFQASPLTPLYVLERQGTATGKPATLRARALRDLSYAMVSASEDEAATYEAETEVLAHMVAASATGEAPPFDKRVMAATSVTGAPARKTGKWAEVCNAATAS